MKKNNQDGPIYKDPQQTNPAGRVTIAVDFFILKAGDDLSAILSTVASVKT